ncbi:MAG TPA: UpxY family transcription antiterminator [Lacibacter sp.]|nr:UpxY family transcription antiterminator [Lacibacter sp.]HMO90215.1 UpxY family transcription antiterminator [Lacibacter sp.]
MSNTRKWYAVYTRPRTEKKVAEQLTRKGFETYAPLNRVVRQWSDRKKIIYEPLFTSYVFVRVEETELSNLRQADSAIVNLVYWLNKPAVIRDAEIDLIRRFLNEHTNVQVERTPIQVNDNIRVLGGPLMDQEGQVVSVQRKTVKVILPSLGYMMQAEINQRNLELLEPLSGSKATHREIYTSLRMVK